MEKVIICAAIIFAALGFAIYSVSQIKKETISFLQREHTREEKSLVYSAIRMIASVKALAVVFCLVFGITLVWAGVNKGWTSPESVISVTSIILSLALGIYAYSSYRKIEALF